MCNSLVMLCSVVNKNTDNGTLNGRERDTNGNEEISHSATAVKHDNKKMSYWPPKRGERGEDTRKALAMRR